MTLEQLKENLENGRKWLERKGFQCDGEIWGGPDGMTIHEPAMLIESCVRECMEEEKPWTCFANYKDMNAADDYYVQGSGRTPMDAMENTLRSWDEEIAKRRLALFEAIREDIQEAPDYERLQDIRSALYGLQLFLDSDILLFSYKQKAIKYSLDAIEDKLLGFEKRLRLIMPPKAIETEEDAK